MNREQFQKDLEQLEKAIAEARYRLFSLEGAAGYVRGKLAEMDKQDRDIMQRTLSEIKGDGELPV